MQQQYQCLTRFLAKFFFYFADIFQIHKTHHVIQPSVRDGRDQRLIVDSTRQTVNNL